MGKYVTPPQVTARMTPGGIPLAIDLGPAAAFSITLNIQSHVRAVTMLNFVGMRTARWPAINPAMRAVPTGICDSCKLGGAKMLLPTSNDKWGVRENDPISLKLFGDSRDRFWHEVEALKIVQNRLSCALCSAIWKSFTISNGNVPPPTELDGKRLRVRSLVMPYAYWFPGYSYSGECAIQRLSIILYRPLGLADCYEEDPLREPILTNFFAFQACENSPLNVSEVCDLNGAQLTSNRISFGGRLRPLKADLRLISWWIKVCLQKHKSTCQQPPVVSPSGKELNLRVIDIEQGCIVEAPFESNFIYIALSYVWGDSHCLDLLTSNENFLTKPGSLNSQRLPATYSDLTQLSLELGCRYVWIDRLCIRQDDQEDLSKYLSIMDEIYGSAFLTVIAASGKKCACRITRY